MSSELLPIKKPEIGRPIIAVIKQFRVWQTATPELVAVDEPDCDYRFVSNGSELGYEWDVVYWEYK